MSPKKRTNIKYTRKRPNESFSIPDKFANKMVRKGITQRVETGYLKSNKEWESCSSTEEMRDAGGDDGFSENLESVFGSVFFSKTSKFDIQGSDEEFQPIFASTPKEDLKTKQKFPSAFSEDSCNFGEVENNYELSDDTDELQPINLPSQFNIPDLTDSEDQNESMKSQLKDTEEHLQVKDNDSKSHTPFYSDSSNKERSSNKTKVSKNSLKEKKSTKNPTKETKKKISNLNKNFTKTKELKTYPRNTKMNQKKSSLSRNQISEVKTKKRQSRDVENSILIKGRRDSSPICHENFEYETTQKQFEIPESSDDSQSQLYKSYLPPEKRKCKNKKNKTKVKQDFKNGSNPSNRKTNIQRTLHQNHSKDTEKTTHAFSKNFSPIKIKTRKQGKSYLIDKNTHTQNEPRSCYPSSSKDTGSRRNRRSIKTLGYFSPKKNIPFCDITTHKCDFPNGWK